MRVQLVKALATLGIAQMALACGQVDREDTRPEPYGDDAGIPDSGGSADDVPMPVVVSATPACAARPTSDDCQPDRRLDASDPFIMVPNMETVTEECAVQTGQFSCGMAFRYVIDEQGCVAEFTPRFGQNVMGPVTHCLAEIFASRRWSCSHPGNRSHNATCDP